MSHDTRTRARQTLTGVWVSVPLVISVACGTSKSSPDTGVALPNGGVTLNLPVDTCPDASMIAPIDAGTCVLVQPRSFSADIVPLFGSCGGEVCHSFEDGRIKLEIGQPSAECCSALEWIEPFHPERSYVLRKLQGENLCAGSQMPLDRTPFDAAEIQAVSDWICQGAGTTN